MVKNTLVVGVVVGVGLLQGSNQAQAHIPQEDIFSLQTLYALERVKNECAYKTD